MPAGLDGSPDPIVTAERELVLEALVGAVANIDRPRVSVGIDGAPGTGKSTIGDELAERLRASGHHVVRSTIDSFHRPRAERVARGGTSAEGYYLDSHQLDTVTAGLLAPFARGDERVRTAAFDEPTDTALDEWATKVPRHAVLVFDGIFLHRRELSQSWDLTIFLLAEARRAAGWEAYLTHDLPDEPASRRDEIERRLARARWPRYHAGWQLYLDTDAPVAQATIVVDNDDVATPVIVTTRAG